MCYPHTPSSRLGLLQVSETLSFEAVGHFLQCESQRVTLPDEECGGIVLGCCGEQLLLVLGLTGEYRHPWLLHYESCALGPSVVPPDVTVAVGDEPLFHGLDFLVCCFHNCLYL